ncbi:hypothetical protein, partial [Pseudomonas sp. DCB_BG]|uniref:hypothetical protein n=1 Tax=Pseudomonas sp. DCB_BG TaxID=2993595 RepID=UPI003A4D8597
MTTGARGPRSPSPHTTITMAMAQVQLQESGGGLVQTGGSLRLSCVASGRMYGIAAIGWFRQVFGEEREFVGAIRSGGGQHYSDDVKGRFHIVRDDAKNTVYLQMNDLKPEDTGVYYCTILHDSQNMPLSRGQGTQVTVSSHHHH